VYLGRSQRTLDTPVRRRLHCLFGSDLRVGLLQAGPAGADHGGDGQGSHEEFYPHQGYVFMAALADLEASGLIAYNLTFAELTVITAVFLPTKVKSRS
jgi:hypothetical protein